MIDDLNAQLEKLKEINGQLEYSWNQKYTEMVNVKDLDYNEINDDYKRQLTEQRLKHESQIRELKKEFQHDIGVVDLELKR
jgi:gas vesicle protein